ncbi:MAG TPA: LamG domain-containing protein [Candidatus Acidoferrales bacterium]|nr:LamG domain-containing protein [Candidatus Acidoferrales bacterium]
MKTHALLITSTLLLPFFVANATAQSFVTNGLVAYYPFNGDANDASGNGDNGTVNGAILTMDRNGITNSAYNFNGTNNYISFPTVPTAQVDNWTISAWLKPGSTNQIGIAIGMGFDNGSTGNGYSLGIAEPVAMTPGNQMFSLFGGLGQVPGGYHFTDTNQWYQAVMLRSSGVLKFYLNGVQTPNTSTSTPLTPAAFRIGSNIGLRFFNGVIDDVRIYNRALSSNEVASLYAYESGICTPYAAQATTLVVNGFVVGATITDFGCGYTNTPQVRILNGGDGGAQAASVVSNGFVVAINITNPGAGYTNAPLIVIDPPFISNPVLAIAPVSMLTFSNLVVGTNYQFQFYDPNSTNWLNQGGTFSAGNTVYTQTVAGATDGSNYRLAVLPLPIQAKATAQVVNGFVTGANVSIPGSGYVTPPAVVITAIQGTNAVVTANISGGHVTSFNILNPGGGYFSPVTVQIDPPPVMSISPGAMTGFRLDSRNLVPYYNYQTQSRADLSSAWTNFGQFTPTATTYSQYFFPTNTSSFFQVQYLP